MTASNPLGGTSSGIDLIVVVENEAFRSAERSVFRDVAVEGVQSEFRPSVESDAFRGMLQAEIELHAAAGFDTLVIVVREANDLDQFSITK